MDALLLPATAEHVRSAFWVVGGLVVATGVVTVAVPGREVEERPRRMGGRRRTKLVALPLLFATHLAVAFALLVFDVRLGAGLRNLPSLLLVAHLLVVAVVLLARPRADEAPEAALRPSRLGVDLKRWVIQTGTIAFGLVTVAFGSLQFERHGEISSSLGLHLVFAWLFVVTQASEEEASLESWAVRGEPLGAFFVWRHLVGLPLFATLPGWTLVDRTDAIAPPSMLTVAALSVVFGLSLWMLRGANDQKARFRRDPDALIWGQPARSIGGHLLVSGFWGIGRHLNYTGEVGVFLGLALTAGLSSWIPYLVPAAVLLMLIGRAGRDERRCQERYGDLWAVYREHARFRMFP